MRTRNEILEEIEQLEEEIKSLENCDNEEEYIEMLNDSYGMADVCGFKYYSGDLLKEIDPIAFNCGHSDYNDSVISDKEDEIEDLKEELDNLEGA
jgi:hypothetical protein